MNIVAQVMDAEDKSIPAPPTPGTYHLEWRKQLAASEDASVIGHLLMNAHWKLEGWPLPTSMPSALKHAYTQQACAAIRSCSDVEVSVAKGKAERFALNRFFDVRLEMLRAADKEESEKVIRKFAQDIIYEFQFCLKYGPDVLSGADAEVVRDLLLPGDGYDARRI